MRDFLIVGLVVAGSFAALRRPWIGIMVWTWLSIMNPHRFTWGFAYDAPLAAIVAVSTMVGLLMTRERESPFKSGAPVILAVLVVWITLSWQFGFDPQGDQAQWDKVIKILGMIFLTLVLLRSKRHIYALAWVCAGSLALLGIKGGMFTLTTGGGNRVWGPPGSFIEGNNEFALALVMSIPLLRFLQLQIDGVWPRRLMMAVMVLMAASALGSHSRGGLLAIVAMTLLLWWRGRDRVTGGLVIVLVAVALLAFMPAEWDARMATIETYDEDSSALGRFAAWWVAWGVATHHFFGAGFEAARPELFALYSPYPDLGTPVAHSIYFQMLGHHGFVGLALFLLLGLVTWRTAARIRKEAAGVPQARWCVDLAGMCQVSLIGYAVGGAFLSLAYFDLPYDIMSLLVLTQAWVRRKGWQTEPAYAPGWRTIPGLADPPKQATGPC